MLDMLDFPEGDHPRACGEKLTGRDNLRIGQGSPPRVRGKEKDEIVTTMFKGITPARAGKSIQNFFATKTQWDHPRACGEKICDYISDA